MATQTRHKPITVTVFHDPEAWIRENLPHMAWDNVACVHPHDDAEYDFDGRTRFVDDDAHEDDGETKPIKRLTMDDFVRGLQLLCEQVGHTLFVGDIHSPLKLTDPGNWDIEVVDAYFQLCYYGRVVYG